VAQKFPKDVHVGGESEFATSLQIMHPLILFGKLYEASKSGRGKIHHQPYLLYEWATAHTDVHWTNLSIEGHAIRVANGRGAPTPLSEPAKLAAGT
jgi:hypothetical protein